MKTWYVGLKKDEMVDAINNLIKVKRQSKAMQHIIRIGFMNLSKADIFGLFYHKRKQLEKILNK